VLQVFGNLIGNAIKFGHENGHVTVGAEPVAAGVRFWVRDDGPGIAAELMPHVFDAYTQARATAKLGRGLGLSIARGLVEAHGGTIGVVTAPGEGCEMHFILPAAAPAPAGEPAPAPARGGRHVLIVDDEADARAALRDVLVEHGLQ